MLAVDITTREQAQLFFLRRSAGKEVMLPLAQIAADGATAHAVRGLLSETTDYVVATTSSPPKPLKRDFHDE